MTAEEVKRLQVGEAVKLCGDSGESVECIVAFQGDPANKFLTYRTGLPGEALPQMKEPPPRCNGTTAKMKKLHP